MADPLVRFVVAGEPRAQPRLRPNPLTGGVWMPPTAQGWRDLVTLAARDTGQGPFKGALNLHIHFCFRRPKSHLNAAGNLKPNAPEWFTKTPDLDNLEKSTKDALNGVLWVDDAQIVCKTTMKSWSTQPSHAKITIWGPP